MLRPLSTAWQDVASYVRYPAYVCSYVYVCVLVCEREYILCELLGVGLVSAGCCVHCRQPGKMLRLTSGTPHNVCTCVCVCVCVREREIIFCVSF